MKQLIVNFIEWVKNIFKNLFFKKKTYELHYFLPGEIVLQIRHPAAATPGDVEKIKASIADAMQSFLRPDGNSSQQVSVNATSASGRNWRNRLDVPTDISKFITFTNKQISLVPVQVSGYNVEKDMDTKAMISILKDAYADLQANNSLDIGNGLSIQSISPNWLMGNLHHGGATGGPGGRPTQAPTPQVGAQSFRVFDGAMQLLPDPPTALPGTSVYVAILDTAPSAEAIVRAYHDWPNHTLIQELFSANGRLTIHRASPATLYSLEHYSLALHDYLMPDHGTFIAGIINNGAPGATLHLYEVLSRYGVGTFTSVAQGILDAISDHRENHPLIINCSFMFCLPDGTAEQALIQDLDVPINALTSTGLLTKTMREVFEGIVDPNITIVASAGNNSKPGQREPARFPAAFNNVIGVGALRKGNSQNATSLNIPASYSNLADDPPANGFMTLGGEP
ncbi:MAG: S8/S53 family peptidase, partial [Anaerolineae bacterium]|nr:S8/S53 family peptidase [Anaerolineae bacterium]